MSKLPTGYSPPHEYQFCDHVFVPYSAVNVNDYLCTSEPTSIPPNPCYGQEMSPFATPEEVAEAQLKSKAVFEAWNEWIKGRFVNPRGGQYCIKYRPKKGGE